MTTTIFKKVDYELAGLMNDIDLGRIGLPDIQRPFVWRNVKVRDLFDSMYKGFPVGYLLLWENGHVDGNRRIGADDKQVAPQLVIVDGQQRLTSLYSVVKDVPVVRDNYQTERIRIAFHPLEEKFEVANAAILRDKSYIPDISQVLSNQINLFQLVGEYLEGLSSVQNVSLEEQTKVQESLVKLLGLHSFPFTALQLDADVSEEDVSEVFVRINSQGKSLNQTDFILTLMSVFWDSGRAQLEEFCREAKTPAKSGSSPFNHFIEPSPDQLLRASVGLAFKRARLGYVYSILRGKDLETEKFSTERRDEQFEVLKKAQERVLNVQYWHDFLRCIHHAGFRSGRMISSENNLLFSYILYLIGRTEYRVPEFTLRQVIAQWFFMSAVTGRYTGSSESTLESDFALLRDAADAEQFVTRLESVCLRTLTNDFWEITLPSNLATSGATSPSRFAYEAALMLHDAPGLYSRAKVSDLLDPSIQSIRPAVERHHLFPRGYLEKLGIGDTRDRNRIANFAFVEWADNLTISDQAPADYVPPMEERFSESELIRMYHYHALPKNWQQLQYREFLDRRQELIAQVIREGYEKLAGNVTDGPFIEDPDVSTSIATGESDAVEFKSTLRRNLRTGERDPRMEHMVLKTLAAFLNSNGGKLIIGVADDGTPVGIEEDDFDNEDRMALHLVNIGNDRMGPQAMASVHIHFDDYEETRVMVADCRMSPAPVYVKDGNREYFYIRTGPSTTELGASHIHDYIRHKFNR